MVRLILMLFAFMVIGCGKDKNKLDNNKTPCDGCIYYIQSGEFTTQMDSEKINEFFFNNQFQGNLCQYLDTVNYINSPYPYEYRLVNKRCD